jgi:hypothetical protein
MQRYPTVGDAEEQLYPGCTCFSKLRFVVRLLHIKSLGGWSDKSFNMLLELQKEAFPKGSKLPKNFHEAKKMIRCLRLDYVSIHACDNDCILFWKEHANADCCPKCKASRWKSQKKRPDGRAAHKVPVKVLRYFPIAKRLQRLFISAKSATDCRWHDEGRTKDGLLRHPADSPAWKHFDAIHTRKHVNGSTIVLITQILELDYDNKGNVVLFKCEWFDNRVQDKWVKVDKFGITHVNRKHLIHTGHKSSDAPFILASQATQVYYVEDPQKVLC